MGLKPLQCHESSKYVLGFEIEQWEVGEKVEHPRKKRLCLSVRKFTILNVVCLSVRKFQLLYLPPPKGEQKAAGGGLFASIIYIIYM